MKTDQHHTDISSRRKAFAAVLVVVAVAAASGCGVATNVGRGRVDVTPAYGDSLRAQIQVAFENQQFESAEAKARELITNFAGYRDLDAVYLIAARSSYLMGNHAQAVKYAMAIPEQYAVSPYVGESLFLAADSYRELGMYFESADVLLQLLSSAVDPELGGRALNMLKSISQDQLGVGDLERLVKKYPSSALAGDMTLGLAKREFARGNYDQAYSLLADLLYEFPQHKRSPEVRQLLKLAASRKSDPDRGLDYVEPYKLGVVLPTTGNYSRFGRYFEQGIDLAVDEYNASSDVPVSVAKRDSHGEPVEAVNAVRELVLEEGVLAILGSVLSPTAIAVAVESNAWKVPVLSPVSGQQRIDEIGPWVFQTKVSGEIEVSAMARVAREDLLLERFAVLAPERGQKHQLAKLFVREVLARGGLIVAEQSYKPGATDFKEQLEEIKNASPEALFIPGEAEELILALPQVSFYDMRIQLIGLSNWNSEKLLRLSQREIEGAVFPREAVHGKDRESFQHFISSYKQRFGGEINPVATAGYFGMRLLLQSVRAGAVDRTQVRDFLATALSASAEGRMAEANSLSILKVRSGKPREFKTSLRR